MYNIKRSSKFLIKACENMKRFNLFSRLIRLLAIVIILGASQSTLLSQQYCDVNLIEVALVDVTGLNGQPDYNNAHLCSIGDTIRVEFGTPGITCNPTATLTLNELRMILFDGFVVEDVIISGGVGGPFALEADYAYQEIGGVTSVDMNSGLAIQMDQNNPVIVDFVLEPNCTVAGISTATPQFELDYSLPGNIPAQTTGDGVIELRGFVFEPFINIVSSSTTPMAALPGEEVCREVRIINNGQFSLLDSMYYKDVPDFSFGSLTSFDLYPIESGVEGSAIDMMPLLAGMTTVDSIELLLDGSTYGGGNGLFEVDGGVRLEYCMETMCPASVNNSMLSAWYGCDGDICQQSDQLESMVVVFNGIPDLIAERRPVIPDDPCVDPLMWEFRIVNDSINGGALESLDGEADAQDINACIYRNECEIFEWTNYEIGIAHFDGTFEDFSGSVVITDLQDSVCFSSLPDLGVNDTLIFRINLTSPPDEGTPVVCEELVNQDNPSCFDPWININYEDRCDDMKNEELPKPLSSTLPPSDGNPIISFTEVDYTEPSYCAPGKIVFEMQNLAPLVSPTTVANDIQFYIKKEYCSTFNLGSYQYGSDVSTGNDNGIVVDKTTLDSFYVISIPNSLAANDNLFFSFEIELDCRDSDVCVHPNAECFMPDVKATWKNCYNLRWFTEYEFGYKIIDYKPDPKNSLENNSGGAGPVSFLGSNCSTRNYWYRYQFGGINHDDCRVFLRYKVAQINADGTAGSVMSANEMAAGVASTTGATTHSIISGIGGAPDTLVVEVESDFIESCIEDEEILINVQHASRCTSTVESVLYYESFEVIFECNNGAECCAFKRSCYENIKQCRCGQPGTVPICYLYCIENTSADVCRVTNGCTAPDASFSQEPDPKNFALPCDTMRLSTTAQFIRQSTLPANPPCDVIDMIFAKVDPGPYLDYCPETASFSVMNGGTVLTSSCNPVPYDSNTGEFDLSDCIDWSNVRDGWSISFEADWKVKEDVPLCADGFIMEEMEVEFSGKFIDGGAITNCGSPRTQKTEYFVGDPFVAKMQANLEFENDCQVSANVVMLDDCGIGNPFLDYRPGYIIDSIVYSVSGADLSYVPNSAVLTRNGFNGEQVYSLPTSNITIDNTNGFNIVFENDGSWPEEFGRTANSDSLFNLFFDLEFTECYAYSSSIQASSKIYYHSCGGCGQKEIESPGGIALNNPPEPILNCLGAPIVQTNSDDVQWNIQVGHTPSANLHWVAFDLPSDISFVEILDQNGDDLLPAGQTDGSLTYLELGNNNLDDLTINATFTGCDTTYIPVYVGWACNDFPTEFITGTYQNGESCSVIQKQLAVVRSETGLQASFVNQIMGTVDLCAELPFEVVVKNVGTASHFMQEICLYLPKDGMTIVPGSVCFAHPDTLQSLANPGNFMVISDDHWSITNPDTIVNGQPSQKMTIDLSAFASSLGMDLELPGASFPETNDNKYRFKWKATTDCDYISGSRLFAQAMSVDRCNQNLLTTAESSDIIAIDGLDPRDYNRNQVVLLDTMIGSCVENQIITANIISFPNPIGPNEQMCVVLPSEITLNGVTPFNPVNWDLSSPTITPVTNGNEYCWAIPAGTPPGVLAFNMDITADANTECGMLNFGTFTKVSADAVCVTNGQSCTLEIFTSELEESGVELIPSIKLIEPQFEYQAECGDSDMLNVTASIAIQNQGQDIMAGTAVEVTIFEDANNNNVLDTGEALSTGSYTGGVATSQIVYVDAEFQASIGQLCNIKVIAGGDDCACTTDAEHLDPAKVNLDICGDLPVVCEGNQANLLCTSFDPSGLFLQWSSTQDPDLDYINESTGVFGPAPVGTYIYELTVDAGNGCKFSGDCAMQVIGALGEFTITGEPSCPNEISKCTIELEPICYREATKAESTTSCEILFLGAGAYTDVSFQIQGNNGLISIPGPTTPDGYSDWLVDINDTLSYDYQNFGKEICIQNSFGIEQSAYVIPRIVDNGISASLESCRLVRPCGVRNIIQKLQSSGVFIMTMETPCGTFSNTFNYSSYGDLEKLINDWVLSAVLPNTGGYFYYNVAGTGVFLNLETSVIDSQCTGDYSITIQAGIQLPRTYNYITDCIVTCEGGSVTATSVVLDVNGNEIDDPERFCCIKQDGAFSFRAFTINVNPLNCFLGANGEYENVGLIISDDQQLVDNPLNEILLYSWNAENGDVISQEGNCAYLRWSEEGTYEVCATPLLSPDSGLDCDIPPVCKDHLVRTDDLRASVSVNAAQTCNDISSVTVTFNNPDDIGEVTVCDEDGDIVYQDSPTGCKGISSNMQVISGDCDFGRFCSGIDPSSLTFVTDVRFNGIIFLEEGTPACFTPDGGIDLTEVEDSDLGGQCPSGLAFDLQSNNWSAGSGTAFDEWLQKIFEQNASNFFNETECSPSAVQFENCMDYLSLIGLPDNSFLVFELRYSTAASEKNRGYLIFTPKGGAIDETFTEIFDPGDYIVKVEGFNCGETEEYPFELPEPPSDEVVLSMLCENASSCSALDGSISVTGSTNGVVDSLVLIDADGIVELVDYTALVPPLFDINHSFSNQGVGSYTVRLYTECGIEEMSCDINSDSDELAITDMQVIPYTDCMSDDAEISITVTSDNPIDSILWCGPMGSIINDIGPHASPYDATTDTGIIWGDWTAKIFTACGNIQEVFNIPTPPPAASIQIDCEGVAPANCLETFGSLNIDVSSIPTGFAPDSIVLTNGAGYRLVDNSGSLSVSFAPLVPGTYEVMVYVWEACNIQSTQCVVPDAENELIISSVQNEDLPCQKLSPDSLTTATIFYSVEPSSLPITRVDWYKGSSVASGILVNSNSSPAALSDSYDIPSGESGNYCVVVIAGDDGVLSSCPRDTFCFEVLSTECPPDCALEIDTLNVISTVDCDEGISYSFEVEYNASGCVVEEGLETGEGKIEIRVVNMLSASAKALGESNNTSDKFVCPDAEPGMYQLIVSYVEDEFSTCADTMIMELPDVTGIEYTLVTEVTPTPCNESNGTITVVSIKDDLGNIYDLTNFDYILYNGFTPIASITSPLAPVFSNLMTGLYTVEIVDVVGGCPVGMVGAIVPNDDAPRICPNSVIASNNCGPCDGTIIMPDSLGIIYRLQDPEGNIVFPQDAPNDHIFIDVCSGMYQIIAYDLSLSDPSECPAICDALVPISDEGFTIKLDTLSGSPCELNDGRITVMAQNGNCNYTYELYDLNDNLISDAPVPDPSAAVCSDKSDMMMFLGLAPGDYKVVGFATDNMGNPMSCMDMDVITLRDNDIDISIDDVAIEDVSCEMSSDGSFCITKSLDIGETMVIMDLDMNVLASYSSADVMPYCISELKAGNYQIRISAGQGLFACTEIIDVVIEEPDPLMCVARTTDPTGCNTDDGSVSIQVSGGTSDYSIVWDDGSVVGFKPNGLSVGVYSFVITDANGCQKQDSVELSFPICNEPCPDIVEEFAVVNAECGESNGNIYVTVQGGGNYTYLWDTGDTGQELSGLSAGLYCVTITSLSDPDCVYEACQEVDEFDGPLASAVSTSATCDEDGKIRLTFSGGTPDYMITWDGPGANDGGPMTGNSPFNIRGPEGQYGITVTDSEGCQNVVYAIIDKEPGLQITASATQFPSCTENIGQITINVIGGELPYQYYVNDVLYTSSNSSSIVVSELGAGSYFLRVSDGADCQGEAAITLETGGAPMSDPDDWVAVPAICSGDNGKIQFLGGGSADIICRIYAENSTVPIGETTADSAVTFDAPVGNYSVVCEDIATGCKDVLDGIVVTAPEPLDFVVQYYDSTCDDNMDGAIIEIVEITGGYLAEDLIIEIINNSNNEIISTSMTTTSLNSGTYTVSVSYVGTDGETNCSKSRVVSVVNEICVTQCPHVDIEVAVRDANCKMSDATAFVTVQDDNTDYSFEWSHGPTTQFVDELSAGIYYVTVTSTIDTDCQYVKSVPVGEIGGPIITYEVIDPTCSTDGSITVFANGGNEDYVISWNGPDGTDTLTMANATTTISGGQGVYEIEVTDQQGCNDYIVVELSATMGLDLTVDMMVDASCNSYDGSASLNIGGGVADYVIMLNGQTLATQSSNNYNFNNLPSGNYLVEVIDSNGCSNEITFTIEDDNSTPIDPDFIEVTSPDCSGDEGVIRFTGNGLSSTVYNLYREGATVPIATTSGDETAIWFVQEGIYYISATLANGCTAILDDIEIKGPEVLDFWVQYYNPTCEGSDGRIEIVEIENYLSSDVSIIINDGTSDTQIDPDTTITGLDAGSYTITVIYEGNQTGDCSKSVQLDIEDPICNLPCPDIIPEFAVLDAKCREDDGSIAVTVQGDGDYSYLWDTGATFSEITGLSGGIYCVTITSADNPECIIEACQEVDEILGPSISSVVEDATCQEDGTITISMINAGSLGQREITWDGPGDNDGGPVVATDGYMITGPAGEYQIIVQDNSGCNNYLLATIGQVPDLTLITEVDMYPDCDSNTGEVSISVSGAMMPYQFFVNDVLSGSQSDSTFNLFGLAPGIYNVEVIDAQGCLGETMIVLDTQDGPTIDPSQWTTVDGICSADFGTIMYDGNGPETIVYKVFADGASVPLAQTLANQSLNVQVSMGEYFITCEETTTGCTDILSGIKVESPEELDFVVQYIDPTCPGGMQDGIIRIVEITGGYDLSELDIEITGEGQIFSGELSTGFTLTQGSYSVSVCYTGFDDETTCCKSIDVNLADRNCVECPDFVAEVAVLEPHCNQADGYAYAVVQGNPTLYTFEWSNGAYGQYAYGLSGGQYYVTITNTFAPDCPQVKEFTVGEIGAPLLYPEVIHPTCEVKGSITIPISGNTQTYTVTWTGPEGTQSATVGNGDFIIDDLMDGIYMIEVSDAIGCMDFAEVELITEESLDLMPMDMSMAECGTASGQISIDVSGGTPDYTFSINNAVVPPQASSMYTFTDLEAGTYIIEVIDANGCRGDTLVTVQNFEVYPDNIPFTNYMHAECGTDTGTITVNGRGDAENLYEIFALGSDVPVGALYGDQTDFFTVIPGEYYLLCTDPNGCKTVVYNFDVLSPPILDFWVQYECSTCEGGLNDGVISVVDITGYPTSELEIIIGGDIPDTHIEPNTTMTGLAPGHYTVSVIYTSLNGIRKCPKTVELEICEPVCSDVCPDIEAEVAVVDAECGSDNGNAIIIVQDDPDGYQYEWSHGLTSQDATDLSPGIYYVTITSVQDSDCQYVREVIIGEIGGPIAEANVTNAPCGGTGGIDVFWTNGQADYTITWDGPDANDGSITTSNSFTQISGPKGTYTIEIEDGRQCSDFLIVEIEEDPLLDIIVDNVTDANCSTANGVVSLSVSGGTSPYTFVLNNDISLTGNSVTFEGLNVGMYSIEVIDAEGCVGNGIVIVESITPPEIDLSRWSVVDANCSEDQGVISYSGNGDVGIIYNVFAVGSTTPFTSTVGNQAMTVEVPAGEYYISSQSSNGCIGVSDPLSIESSNVLDFTVQYYDPLCEDSNDGIIEIVEITGGYQSSDYDIEITDMSNTVISTTEITNGLSEGMYFIKVSYTGLLGESCTKTRSVELTVDYCCQDLSGEVFYDWDSDGCQDESEELGVADVDVYIYDCAEDNPTAENALGHAITNDDGEYTFGPHGDGLAQLCLHPDSSYYVVFDLPNGLNEELEGFEFSPDQSGACDMAYQSDNVNSNNGQSDCHDPEDDDDEDGDEDNHVDAGITPCESLGGQVFFDWDQNGCQDSNGETGVEDVIVYLYSCNEDNPTVDNALAQDTTDMNGDYGFGGREEGSAQICLHPDSSYYVVFDIPNGEGETLFGYDITPGDGMTCDGEDNQSDLDDNIGQSDCHDPEDDDDDDGDEDEHIDLGLVPIVDVALVKTTEDEGPFRYGDQITFDIEVFNQGMMDLHNVKVNDFIPCGYKYLSSNNDIWGYDPFNSIATTTVPFVPVDSSVIVSIDLQIFACNQDDPWLNIAEVESFTDMDGRDITINDIDSNGDDDPDNDEVKDDEYNEDGRNGGDEDDHDPENIDIFDLALIKTIQTEGPYFDGDTVEFKITVVNQGNISAANIMIADHLPSGYAYNSSLNPDWVDDNAPLYIYTIPEVLHPEDTICVSHYAIVSYDVERIVENYTNIAEISSNTDEDGNPVVDADSDPDNDPDNDGDPIDDQLNDRGDEDDHDPASLDLLDDFPPDCVFECQIACVHAINLSLDNTDCMTTLTPSLLIAGLDPSCDEDDFYTLTLMDEHGNVISPPTITAEHIGMQLTYKIENECGNSCWGYVNVEYKQSPTIDCSTVTTSCLAYEFDCPAVMPPVDSGCLSDSARVELIGETYDFIDCGSSTMTIERVYQATDVFGNQSSCTQTIELEPIDTSNITYPMDIIIGCEDLRFEYDDNNVPLPWLPDYTSGLLAGVPLYRLDTRPAPICTSDRIFPNADSTQWLVTMQAESGIPCNSIITYSDVEVSTTDCHRKIMRTWEYLHWACNTSVSDNRVQVIEIRDNRGPTITCPEDQTISAVLECSVDVTFGEAVADDDCNGVLDYTLSYPDGFNYENGGRAELPLGESILTYRVYDNCGNSSSCDTKILITDSTVPVAVCDQHTVITLSSSGRSRVPAHVFDDGSYDGCDDLTECVMRMDELEAFRALQADLIEDGIKYVEKSKLFIDCKQDDIEGQVIDGVTYISESDLCRPYVHFCCEDMGGETMLVFRVTDVSGNSNQCMVSAQIKDLGSPDINCPDDITVDCEADVNSLPSDMSEAILVGNCNIPYPVSMEIEDLRNSCNLGDAIREFSVRDNDGNILGTCTQRVHFDPVQVFDPSMIVWPQDFETDCAAGIANLEPELLATEYGAPDLPLLACSNLGIEHEDEYFTVRPEDGDCAKILRTWKVIDWCRDTGDPLQVFTRTQTIKLNNHTGPTLVSKPDTVMYSNVNDCADVAITLTCEATDDCTPSDRLLYAYTLIYPSGQEIDGNTSSLTTSLPEGAYNIIWTVTDACGNRSSDTQHFTIVNQKVPLAYCKSGISVTIEEEWKNTMITVAHLDSGSEGGCPGQDIDLSFSLTEDIDSLILDCSHVGMQNIRLYVISTLSDDLYASCVTEVTVDDHHSVCTAEGGMVDVGGSIYTEDIRYVENVNVGLSATNMNDMTNAEGDYAFPNMPQGGQYEILPHKDDHHLNGVSTLDLVIIQRHILGIDRLDSPYQMIAADVDNNEAITATDLIELRKLILGVYNVFPDNTSWRFVDEGMEFSDEQYPWLSTLEESYRIYNLQSDMDIDFIGIKVGDVNGSVTPNLLEKDLSDRSQRWSLRFEVVDRELERGDGQWIDVLVNNYERISGWQGTLIFDPKSIDIKSIESDKIDFSTENVNYKNAQQGKITFSFADNEIRDIKDGTILLKLGVDVKSQANVSDILSLSSALTPSEAYRGYGEVVPLLLEYGDITKDRIVSVNPNPWVKETEIAFSVAQDGEVRFDFFDVTGRKIFTHNAVYDQGDNKLRIDKNDITTLGLIYINMITSEGVSEYKMVKL